MSSACLENINSEFYIKLYNAWQECSSIRVIYSEMFHVQAVPLEQYNLHCICTYCCMMLATSGVPNT